MTHGADELVAAVKALADAGIALDDIALRRPTLDDVFLTLTGRTAEAAEAEAKAQADRKKGSTDEEDSP